MKHGSGTRRGRNRGNGKRGPSKNQTFESNGPDGKIRGTAQQVLDRYLALGRDASSTGDPITAEGFYQHAEHYYRIVHAGDGNGSDSSPDRQRRGPIWEKSAQEGPVIDQETAEESAETASEGLPV